MKRFTLIALGLLATGTVFGQRVAPVSQGQLEPLQYNVEKFNPLNDGLQSQAIVKNHPVQEETQIPLSPNGKTAAVNPVELGKASNVFTILRTEQNQVYADESLELVTFIHRQDINTWGGSSGNLRFDMSTDGGASFSNDIGEINPMLTRPSRYPNLTGFNPNNDPNPANTFAVYSAPTLNPTPDWDGHVTGMWTHQTASTGTENYDLLSSQSYLQGGLCEGLPGDFWNVDRGYDGSALLGDIWLNKGTYNGSNDIVWEREDTLSPNHYTGFDGSARMVGPNIAFSDDGMTGWIAWLGDLDGQGLDTAYSPVFVKSTDGGASWGTPVEYNLNSMQWVMDSLQSLWIDSTGNPAGTGRASASFEYDLVVDGNGNPHMAIVVCNASVPGDPPQYSIYPGLAKFFADVYSPDGGATWEIAYISPVLTFRTPDFGTTTTVSMDNQPQISTNASGDKVFYSWADSDTAALTGSMNGIGFGESSNLAPNLRIAAMDVVTGAQTYPKRITDGDLYWEGLCLFPTMAPTTMEDDNTGEYQLPIVFASMQGADPLAQTTFYYLGNDALIDEADFCDPQTMTLGWDQSGWDNPSLTCDVLISNNPTIGTGSIVVGNSYPNPTNGVSAIPFELPAATNVNLSLVNIYGQEVKTLLKGEVEAGQHVARVNTSDLAAGVYFYRFATDNEVITKHMVVTK